jgi:hypothetical protein
LDVSENENRVLWGMEYFVLDIIAEYSNTSSNFHARKLSLYRSTLFA